MTPELVDRAHARRFVHCDWLQPRSTSQGNERVYFWSKSHITVASKSQSQYCEQAAASQHHVQPVVAWSLTVCACCCVAIMNPAKRQHTHWSVDSCAPIDVKVKSKGGPYSISEPRVPELIPVLGSQPAGDVSHKPGGRLPLLSARPAVTFPARRSVLVSLLGEQGTMGVNSLPKTVTRQRRGCHLNSGPTAPESSTQTTRLPSHPHRRRIDKYLGTRRPIATATDHVATDHSGKSQSLDGGLPELFLAYSCFTNHSEAASL